MMCCASYNCDTMVLCADLWVMVFNAHCLMVFCSIPAIWLIVWFGAGRLFHGMLCSRYVVSHACSWFVLATSLQLVALMFSCMSVCIAEPLYIAFFSLL